MHKYALPVKTVTTQVYVYYVFRNVGNSNGGPSSIVCAADSTVYIDIWCTLMLQFHVPSLRRVVLCCCV